MPFEQMNQILPHLYLGNMFAAKNAALLEQNKISHVLVVGVELRKHFPEKFEYYHVSVDDEETEDLLSHFPQCFEFIKAGLDKGGVLVHCAAGVSRSSTVTIGFLMHQHKWTYQYAMKHVQTERPCIWPNTGFVKQLELLEKMGHVVNTESEDYVAYVEDIKKRKAATKPRPAFTSLF